MSESDHDVQGTTAVGGVPDAATSDGAVADSSAGSATGAVRADETASLDATLRMDDEEWLEHALGDLHSSAWTTPTVEL